MILKFYKRKSPKSELLGDFLIMKNLHFTSLAF